MSEEIVGDMQNQGILIPGEAVEVEGRARSQGWSSKEEFEANPNNAGKKWRPADEFLERGELFDTIKSLKHELTGIKRDFNNLASHHQKVAKVEYERALNTLKTQRKVAAEEGDTSAVVELSDAIEELKTDFQTQREDNQSTQAQPHPAFQPWLDENSWYTADEELRAIADVQAKKYYQTNPNPPFEDVLKHVSKYMKEKYISPKRVTAPSVEGGTNGASSQKKSKFSKADLSDMERDIMRTMVARKVMTEQEYVDELAKAKGL